MIRYDRGKDASVRVYGDILNSASDVRHIEEPTSDQLTSLKEYQRQELKKWKPIADHRAEYEAGFFC